MYYISEPGPRCSGSNTFTPNSWRRLSWFKTTLALSRQYLIFSTNETYEKIRKPTTYLLTSLLRLSAHRIQWGRKSLKRAKKKKKYNPESREDRALCKFCITNKSGQVWILPQVNRWQHHDWVWKGIFWTFSGRFSHFWEQLITVIFTGGNSSQVSSHLYKDGEDSLTVLFSALQYVDLPDGGIPSVHWDHGSHDQAQITKGG